MQTHESQEHIEDTSKPEKTEHKEEATDHEQYNQSLSSSGDGTREARIALRKNRIQAARVAKSRVENTEGINNNNPVSENSAKPTNEPERKDAGKSQNQITVSKKRMDATKLSGTENVTQVRVSVVAREAQRRVEEAKKVDQWDLKRRQEMEKTSEMQNSIEEEWKKSFKIATPGKLYELLIEQKTACNELIATKNRLINEHVIELKTKDDEYVKELKRQAEEIDTVLARMEAQYKTFQKTLNQEIEQIERAFVEERSELLHKNSNEIENLFTSRRENERKFMEERGERMEDHIQQLEQLRIHDAEEYNLVKIKLETDVKVLEQQLQQMRGTYQLNTEKLDYNFQVLKKREEENGAILSAQKRKIARLSDHLNVLKSKIQKQEKSFQQEYISLTDDYKRITDQFKELQKKFRHFQMADSKRYRQVWAMNEEMAKEKLRKVLQADRIIHEQQLGLEWKAPDDDIFKSETVIQEKPIEKVKELNGAAVLLPLIISEHDDDENGDEIKESFGMKLTRKSYSNTMKNMLELLCNEAGFLVEERLQKLLTPLDKDEQSLMKLDSILKALGVETIQDIECLTSHFLLASPDADPSTQLIAPNDVVKAIRAFVEENQNKPRIEEDQVSVDSPDELQATPSSERSYWDRFNTIVDDKKFRTWTAVYKGMEKYNGLLNERWHLSMDIGNVSRQNEELRGLLRQYMNAKVNDDLQVPPTRVMLAQAGLLH